MNSNSVKKFTTSTLTIIFLSIFTIIPIVTLILTSMNKGMNDIFNGGFAFSLHNYVTIFTNSYDLRSLFDTVILALTVSGLSLLISLPISYGLAWTNMPFKKTIRTLLLMGIGIPGFIVALVLIIFTGSIYHSGFDLYSYQGMLFTLALSFIPFQVLYSTLSFERLDHRLIEAASVNGLSKFRTTFRITIPLLAPGILSGFIIVFLLATGSITVPLLLAPSSFPMITPLAYTELLNFFNWTLASAYLSMLFFVNVIAVVIYVFVSRRIPKTVTGKGFRATLNDKKIVKFGLLVYSLLVILVFMGEIAIIAGFAFGRKWVGTVLPTGFTTSSFTNALSLYSFAPWSTMILCVVAGVLAVTISLLIHYGTRIRLMGGRSYLNLIILLVFSLSNIIVGVAYLSIFDNSSTSRLVNSIPFVLLMGYTFSRLGYASNSVRISLDSVSDGLIDSTRLMVLKEGHGFSRIIIPLIAAGLMEGFLLVFVRSAIDYGSTIFLAPTSWFTLSLSSYSFIITGEFAQGASMALLILAMTLPLTYYLYRKRS